MPDRPAVSSRDELRPGQSRPMKETLVGRELRGLLVSLASRFICVTAYRRQGQHPAEGEVMSPDYFNTYSVVVCKAAACCLGLRALIWVWWCSYQHAPYTQSVCALFTQTPGVLNLASLPCSSPLGQRAKQCTGGLTGSFSPLKRWRKKTNSCHVGLGYADLPHALHGRRYFSTMMYEL